MNLIQHSISVLQEKIALEDDPMVIGRLHLELRRLVDQANHNGVGFFCSVCGLQFRDVTSRNDHSYTVHVSI